MSGSRVARLLASQLEVRLKKMNDAALIFG
jgi:hypothetical protein